MVKYKTMLSASSVTWLTANFSAYALLVSTTSIMAKIMKFSTLALGFGLAVVASSTLVSTSTEAATLYFSDGSLSLTSDAFEFEFLPPTQGSYISQLFVTDLLKTSVAQTLFVEPPSNNGTVISPGVVASSAWAATGGNYILGWGPVSGSEPAVYSNDVAPVQFQYSAAESVGGWHVFKIEDIKGGGDRDYNDGKFRVRAVPVPAIVPGIALAAAFFGSKALKRNKKNANESVA